VTAAAQALTKKVSTAAVSTSVPVAGALGCKCTGDCSSTAAL
jgi:hypothetical protein